MAAYLTVAAAVGGLVASVAPTILDEARQLIARAPALLDSFQEWLASWTPLAASATSVRDAIITVLQNFQGMLAQVPMRALALAFDALVVVFLSLYLVIAGPRLKRFTLSLVPDGPQRRRTGRLLARLGHATGGYVRGAAISGVLVGILTWVALRVVGLEYRLVLATLAGLGEFVPYLGPLLAAVPAVLIALSDSSATALGVAGIYLGLQQVESYLITPNVMRTQTNLHPALVILALAAGSRVGGLLGALAALPAFAALRVLLLAAAPAIRRVAAHASAGGRE